MSSAHAVWQSTLISSLHAFSCAAIFSKLMFKVNWTFSQDYSWLEIVQICHTSSLAWKGLMLPTAHIYFSLEFCYTPDKMTAKYNAALSHETLQLYQLGLQDRHLLEVIFMVSYSSTTLFFVFFLCNYLDLCQHKWSLCEKSNSLKTTPKWDEHVLQKRFSQDNPQWDKYVFKNDTTAIYRSVKFQITAWKKSQTKRP